MEVAAPQLLEPASAPRTPPYAARNMIFQDVRVGGRSMVFAVDPWTQHWGIVSAAAKEILRFADGRRPWARILQELVSHNAVGAGGAERLLADLRAHHLVFDNAEQQMLSGGPVYRSTNTLVGLHIEITNVCNLHCTHCYVASGKKLPKELTTPEILHVVDQLPAHSGKRVAVSGGEPTLHPDCLEIVDYCLNASGHDVDLYTNAIRLRPGFLDALAEIRRRSDAHLRIQVSLEGARAETHNRVRGAGSFEAVERTLAEIRTAGLSDAIVLFVCVTKHNIGERQALIELAQELGAGMLVFSQQQRQGYAVDVPWADIAPSLDEWVRAGHEILGREKGALRVFGNFFGDLGNDGNGRFALDAEYFPKHIYYYNAFPRIAPNGDVFADQLFVDPSWRLGNVREASLEEMFQSPRFFEHLGLMRRRKHAVAECSRCTWRDLCEGGSAGHTFSEFGDLDHRDVFCEARIHWFEAFRDRALRQAEALMRSDAEN